MHEFKCIKITSAHYKYIQITESLQEVFDENKLKLDQTSNIESGTDPLPFDELLDWVSFSIISLAI